MNDQEILKRIAEIEFPNYSYEPGNWLCTLRDAEGVAYGLRKWNPLTNWSDLGPLIEKYTPTMEDPAKTGFWRVCIRGFPYKWIEHKSLPHAILLAIIEAHA